KIFFKCPISYMWRPSSSLVVSSKDKNSIFTSLIYQDWGLVRGSWEALAKQHSVRTSVYRAERFKSGRPGRSRRILDYDEIVDDRKSFQRPRYAYQQRHTCR